MSLDPHSFTIILQSQQVGDTVINDAVERICGYTPIFAV